MFKYLAVAKSECDLEIIFASFSNSFKDALFKLFSLIKPFISNVLATNSLLLILEVSLIETKIFPSILFLSMLVIVIFASALGKVAKISLSLISFTFLIPYCETLKFFIDIFILFNKLDKLISVLVFSKTSFLIV